MSYRPPIAVYDACVLYPFHIRNLLVQCGADRLVEVRWTDEIHDEWIRNLAANVPTITAERLLQTRDLMKRVLPEATVSGYETRVATLALPDPDDRHVVAAAIVAGASHIVTWNLPDFPIDALAPFQLSVQDPDAFLMDRYAAAPDATIAVAAKARRNLKTSIPSTTEFISALVGQKLVRFGAILRSHATEL